MEWIEGKGYKKRILAAEAKLGRGNIVQIVRIGPIGHRLSISQGNIAQARAFLASFLEIS